MKKFVLFIFAVFLFAGCNTIFQYIFMPPEREEYTIVPDPELTTKLEDSSYFVSKDGKMVGYNAKSWKIEIRYMSDFQLNTYEFPEESKQFEFSGNPYTNANWIDPALGYTPRRFSVFKVTIYNYTNSKINYDPETSLLVTDRGDKFNAYAREKKNAKFYSMEEYYQKRKGTSGLDDEVFETRMGIVRRTMLTYGKPIYKGDTRDGLIIFDPVADNIEKLKISIDRFVVSYDENNDPAEFANLEFYFKQVVVPKEEREVIQTNEVAGKDSSIIEMTVAQIKYSTMPGQSSFDIPWNPKPRSLPNLMQTAARNIKIKHKIVEGSFDEEDVSNSHIAFIFGSGISPEFNASFISRCAEYITNGGLIYIDNCNFSTTESPFMTIMENFLGDVQKKLSGKSELKRINLDHPLFSSWKEFTALPIGMDDISSSQMKSDEIKGLFWDGKLVVILSSKGYPVLWSDEGSSYDNVTQLDFGVNLISYSIKNRKK
ncbi:MAG: DUF4159 domain-containing protein [Ignavibacteriaceae bacterium]